MYQNNFQESLMELKGKLPSAAIRLGDPLPNPATVGEDGVDIINIWENGDTELGRALSHSVKLSFTHDQYGRFCNMESFWQYIRSVERDDRVRVLHGYKLKAFAKKLTFKRVPDFHAVIMDANWQKVQQYPQLLEELRDSTLPFDCFYYYNKSDVRIRPAFADWIIYGYSEIRKALQENREPNFDLLKDTKRLDRDRISGVKYQARHTPKVKEDSLPKEAEVDDVDMEIALIMQSMEPVEETETSITSFPDRVSKECDEAEIPATTSTPLVVESPRLFGGIFGSPA